MSQNTELKAQTKKPGLNKKGIAAWINNYSFILIALAIFIAYLFINHGATTWSGVMNILRHSAVVGIMAFGMGLVIITGGIDLSVGSMLALVGSFSVVVFNATDRTACSSHCCSPWWPAACAACSTVCSSAW